MTMAALVKDNIEMGLVYSPEVQFIVTMVA